MGVVALELCFKSWRLFKAIQHPPNVLKPESYLAALVVMVLLYASMLILTFAQRTNPTPVVVVIVLQLYFGCIGGVAAMMSEDFNSPRAKLVFATYIIWHLFTIVVAAIYLKFMPPRVWGGEIDR